MRRNGWIGFGLLLVAATSAAATNYTLDASLPGGGDCAVFGSWNPLTETCHVADSVLLSGDQIQLQTGTFQIDGTFVNEGLFNSTSGAIVVNGFLNNQSSLVNFWTSRMVVRGSFFSHFMYNFGGIYNAPGATIDFDFFLENNSPLRNYGHVDIGGHFIVIPGTFIDNRGSVTIKAGADVDNDGTIVNSGTLEIVGALENRKSLVAHCEGSLTGTVASGNQPIEALSLRMDLGVLNWCDLPSASGFDVVSGSLDTLRLSAGNFAAASTGCLADDTTESSVAESVVLQPGQSAWFLVRATTGGADSYDSVFSSQSAARDGGIGSSGVGCP